MSKLSGKQKKEEEKYFPTHYRNVYLYKWVDSDKNVFVSFVAFCEGAFYAGKPK